MRISFAECPSESGTVGCFTGKINKPPNYKSAGGRVEFGVRSVYALNLTTVYTPPGSARVPCEQIHTNM